jgi:hypothetical protein
MPMALKQIIAPAKSCVAFENSEELSPQKPKLTTPGS